MVSKKLLVAPRLGAFRAANPKRTSHAARSTPNVQNPQRKPSAAATTSPEGSQRLSDVAGSIHAKRESLPLRGIPSAHESNADRETRQSYADQEAIDQQMRVVLNTAHQKCRNNREDHDSGKNGAPAQPIREHAQRDAPEASQQNGQCYGNAFLNRGVFGYVGRPANGHSSFATVAEIGSAWQATKNISVNLYYGHASGKSVVASIYPAGSNAQFGYAELICRWGRSQGQAKK
jgi:hypothetical protein